MVIFTVLVAVPVLGGVATVFWPNRRRADLPVPSVIETAVVNTVGGELPWSGLPLGDPRSRTVAGARLTLGGLRRMAPGAKGDHGVAARSLAVRCGGLPGRA